MERGDIFFAYREKVGAQVARGFEDMARLYMILSAHVERSYRLIIVGEKHLPAVSGDGDRKSCRLCREGRQPAEEVEDQLDVEVYETKSAASANSPLPVRCADRGQG
ncbi:MAG TPA: hypothetical protein VF452_17520 [Candidatus Binatia bacterium]